jgi:hypothetical protein
MKKFSFTPKALPVAVLTVLLAACGGGGDSGGSSNVAPIINEATITGTAVKGVLQKAKVTAYKVADGKKGDKLTETTTNTNGEYTLNITGYNGAVILEMTTDTNTKMLCDIPAGCEGGVVFGAATSANGLVLQTVLGELKATNKTAITPFTHLAAKYAEKNGFNKANIEAALTQIADLFNLPALNETTAVNPAGNLATANTTEQQYAIMNAAIAQLAGKVADISAKLNALSAEINNNNGQLQSSGATGKIDLEDVLVAAKVVSESNVIKVNAAIQTMLNAQLELAKKTTDLTSAAPVSGVGLDDLAKAKAFVNSASLLLSTLQQYGHQSFIDTATQKVNKIQNLTVGDELVIEALAATTGALAAAVEESQASRTLTGQQINQLFELAFNKPYELVATAGNDLKLTIDSTTNTAILNGELKLQRKTWDWDSYSSSGEWKSKNDGSPQGFTISNFKISYPSKTVSTKDFVVAIDANSKIKTAKVELSLASDSQSRILVHFDTAKSLQSHLDAVEDTDETHTPSRVEAKLDKITLKVLNAPNSEISQFVGNATLTGKQVNLDTTTGGKRLWPMPDLATLSGKFSSVDGDVVESTASIDLNTFNPLVSPEQNFINTGFYTYQYSEGNNTITLIPKKGTIDWSNVTQVVLSMDTQHCSGGKKRLMANVGYSWLGNCTSNTNVADAYKEFVSYNYWWSLRTQVDGDGIYIPVYPANFNYKSANAKVDGKLHYSEDTFSEDATHQVKGTITANTKIKLVGNAATDIETLVTAQYAGQESGNVTATIRAGNEKIDVKATMQNGKATVTLSNKNGVSVDVAESTDVNKLDLKVNSVVQGWVYKLNGAPVVKFKDDKIKFL